MSTKNVNYSLPERLQEECLTTLGAENFGGGISQPWVVSQVAFNNINSDAHLGAS